MAVVQGDKAIMGILKHMGVMEKYAMTVLR